jgi:hypothetical protein
VEVRGVEPRSRQENNTFSTSLFEFSNSTKYLMFTEHQQSVLICTPSSRKVLCRVSVSLSCDCKFSVSCEYCLTSRERSWNRHYVFCVCCFEPFLLSLIQLRLAYYTTLSRCQSQSTPNILKEQFFKVLFFQVIRIYKGNLRKSVFFFTSYTTTRFNTYK